MLCGSDVALGLDAVLAGKRNVCTPFANVRHLESATRGKGVVPAADFFASYWRYQHWVSAGDPVLLAEPVAQLVGASAALAVRDDTGGACVAGPRAHAEGVPHAERRRRGGDARGDVPRRRRRRASGRGAARAARGTRGAEDGQLVPPRHRQPVLRRCEHGAPPRRLPRRDATASRIASSSGPTPNEPFFRSAIAAAFPALARLADRVPRRVASPALELLPRGRRGGRDAVGHGLLRRAVPRRARGSST